MILSYMSPRHNCSCITTQHDQKYTGLFYPHYVEQSYSLVKHGICVQICRVKMPKQKLV